MRTHVSRVGVPGCSVSAIGATAASSARAADEAAFYQGKQVRIFTMGSPGGGYDTYTRTVGAFLERKLGAKVIADQRAGCRRHDRNEPDDECGAGWSDVAADRRRGAGDGAALWALGRQLRCAQAGVARARVGRGQGRGGRAAVAHSAPSPTCSRSDKPALWAGSGKADNNSDFSAIMCYALGAKCKIILGYKGTGDMNLAIQRGEVDGRVISDEAAALYGPGSGMRVITTLARARSEKFPDVPTIFEAAKLSPTAARLMEWRANIAGLGRVILATPGTPPERVEVLRRALADVLRDPAYIAEIRKLNLAAGFAARTRCAPRSRRR